ncbi:MAG: type II secretion system protein [Acidobacteriota bacterium]
MKNKTLKQAKNSGFTFVETLVSITILIFVISGVLTMTTVHMKTNFNQINHTKAVKLAEEAIERKMREDFDTLAGETYGFGAIENFPVYSRTVTITTIDAENKRINVSVTWQERSRAEIAPITLSVLRTR